MATLQPGVSPDCEYANYTNYFFDPNCSRYIHIVAAQPALALTLHPTIPLQLSFNFLMNREYYCSYLVLDPFNLMPTLG